MSTAELKVQLLETFAALITAAFGLVAALAWNETIKELIAMMFPTGEGLASLLVYAVVVTILAVVMTLLISKSLGKAKAALKLEEKKE